MFHTFVAARQIPVAGSVVPLAVVLALLTIDGIHGLFATMRRAEEGANGYRAQGFRALAFHNGDGCCVRVSR